MTCKWSNRANEPPVSLFTHADKRALSSAPTNTHRWKTMQKHPSLPRPIVFCCSCFDIYLFLGDKYAIFFYSLIIGEDFLFGIKLSSASVRLDIAVRQTSHSIVMASAVVETQLEAKRIRRRVTVWIHAAAFTCDRIFFLLLSCFFPLVHSESKREREILFGLKKNELSQRRVAFVASGVDILLLLLFFSPISSSPERTQTRGMLSRD